MKNLKESSATKVTRSCSLTTEDHMTTIRKCLMRGPNYLDTLLLLLNIIIVVKDYVEKEDTFEVTFLSLKLLED